MKEEEGVRESKSGVECRDGADVLRSFVGCISTERPRAREIMVGGVDLKITVGITVVVVKKGSLVKLKTPFK